MNRIRLVTGLLLLSLCWANLALGQRKQTVGGVDRLGDIPKLPARPTRRHASGRKESPALRALKGKWIVRAVQRDGKPTAAQIGQKVGDIINIQEKGAHLAVG